jgi:acetyl-CoA carboxylase carboxyltransferase component
VGATDKNGNDFKIAWPSAEWGSFRSRAVSRRPCRREIAAAPDPKGRETEAELRAVASPFPTAQAFGVEDIVDPRETPPTCAASSMRRRAAQGQARAQTEVWRAAMSCPIVSFNERRPSNGPNKSKMEDAEDD